MSTLFGSIAQESFLPLAGQCPTGADIDSRVRSIESERIATAIAQRGPISLPSSGVADRAMDRADFAAANERLRATLERLAPRAGWTCQQVLYPRFEGFDRTKRVGYACRSSGRVVERIFLGFRKEIYVAFDTYSWSWDGSIDEEWLGRKIRAGKNCAYALSDPRTPETRKRIGAPWVRED